MPFDIEVNDILNQLNRKANHVLGSGFSDGLQESVRAHQWRLPETPLAGLTIPPLTEPAAPAAPTAAQVPTLESLQVQLRAQPIDDRLRFVSEALDKSIEDNNNIELLLIEMNELSLHPEVSLEDRVGLGQTLKGMAELLVREYEVEQIPGVDALCKQILSK